MCQDSPLGSSHTQDIKEAGKDPIPGSLLFLGLLPTVVQLGGAWTVQPASCNEGLPGAWGMGILRKKGTEKCKITVLGTQLNCFQRQAVPSGVSGPVLGPGVCLAQTLRRARAQPLNCMDLLPV